MKFFNYIFIVMMSFGALIPHSDFSQLMKIGELDAHYQLHKAEAQLKGQDLDFYEFVYLHFISSEEHEHDNTDHNDLPLHSISSLTIYIIAPVQLFLCFPKSITKINFPTRNVNLGKTITFDIFHPPRFA